MKFEVGDYVMLKESPTFVWRVVGIKSKFQIHADNPNPGAIMPIGDKLTLEPVCTLAGTPVTDYVKQKAWDVDVEEAPAMLVIAWESR